MCQGTSASQKVFLPNMGRAEKLKLAAGIGRFLSVTMTFPHLPGPQYHPLGMSNSGLAHGYPKRPLCLHGESQALSKGLVWLIISPSPPPTFFTTHFPCCWSLILKNSVEECNQWGIVLAYVHKTLGLRFSTEVSNQLRWCLPACLASLISGYHF